MNRDLYFEAMRATSELVDPIIQGSIQAIEEANPELYQFIANIPLLRKRVKKKEKLRPFLMRLAYEVAGGQNWEEIADVCAAVELFNISTYIDNGVFDGKGNLQEEDKNNYIIAARITRSIASELLRKQGSPEYSRLESLLHDIDISGYIGQYADLNQVKVGVSDYDDVSEFLEDYIRRCENLTGRFMGNVCRMGAILSGASEEEVQALGEYGRCVGIIAQIMNDVGDFVPPKEGTYDVEKVYQDQFSDIMHGKLTLPVYYTLMFGSEEEKEAIEGVLGNPDASNEDLESVTRAIVSSGAVDFAKKVAKEYQKEAKSFLHSFEKSESRDALSITTTM